MQVAINKKNIEVSQLMSIKRNSKAYKKPHIIFDAIHKVVEISKSLIPNRIEIVKNIINDPSFQRLKGIKQLGLADMVFPTATHTRFSHSIGAAYLGSRILKTMKDKLGSSTKQNKMINEENSLNLVLAALIHDIGHGPFSHTFEDFFQETLGQKIKHESWIENFIDNFHRKKIINQPTSEGIKEILSASNSKSINEECLTAKEKITPLLKDIISSQLDCDRLDYLLRDSHFCGVEYGRYDLEWLLHSLVPVTIQNSSYRLGISYKGIGSVEHYLISRRLMYLNIYQHKTVSGFTDNLLQFLVLLQEWVNDSDEKKEKILGQFLYNFLKKINEFKRRKSKKIKDFVDFSFDDYSHLTDYDVWFAIRNIYHFQSKNKKNMPAGLWELSQSFMERKNPKVIEISKKNRVVREKEIRTFCKKKYKNRKGFEIKFINPKVETYEKKEKPIYVFDESNNVSELSCISSIISLLDNKLEERVFVKFEKNIFRQIKSYFNK